jgi:hypothetical protein
VVGGARTVRVKVGFAAALAAVVTVVAVACTQDDGDGGAGAQDAQPNAPATTPDATSTGTGASPESTPSIAPSPDQAEIAALKETLADLDHIVDDPAATTAICAIAEPGADPLFGAASDATPGELPDLVLALDERRADIEAAAAGRPELAVLLVGMDQLAASWSAAAGAYESGDDAAGDSHLGTAEATLADLRTRAEDTLAQLDGSCSD